jgi:heparan-alpha-glucosaminide N-acetyltransferase
LRLDPQTYKVFGALIYRKLVSLAHGHFVPGAKNMNDSVPQDVALPAPARVASVDAYRGFVMFLMMAELLRVGKVAQSLPGDSFWELLAFNTDHVAWTGCSLHDLIQPSFSFLVGVALPFSLASRMARGQGFGRMFLHALWRSLLLILLGIFLRSVGQRQTNFTFEDTLTQIGLGYTFLFLLGYCSRLVQVLVLVGVLAGYWGAFVLYPLPPADFSYPSVGVSANWPHLFPATDLAAHWNKNSNLAWAFDQWFLNLFPRQRPFVFNGGGYATLSFVPTLGTMILGLIAGGWLKSGGSRMEKMALLVVAGLMCLGLGFGLDYAGICPSVKRIWTPSWTLYSGGWCFLILAAFYLVMDAMGVRFWAFPLVVIGMNSIAIYVLVHLMDKFILSSLKTHLYTLATWLETQVGADVLKTYNTYQPMITGAAVLLVFWLILLWMYRRKIFIRI